MWRWPKYYKYGPVADAGGVQLYYVNYVSWDEIIEAKAIDYFGLPYIVIKRNKGLQKKWSLALYLGAWKEFKDAVEKHAPANSPLKEVVLSMSDAPKASRRSVFIVVGAIGVGMWLIFQLIFAVLVNLVPKQYWTELTKWLFLNS